MIAGILCFCAAGGEGKVSTTETRSAEDSGSHCENMVDNRDRVSLDFISRGSILSSRDLTIFSIFSWSLHQEKKGGSISNELQTPH